MIDLDTLERLAGEASDGPWEVGRNLQLGWPFVSVMMTDGQVIADTGLRASDAEFIAAARTAIPELVAYARKARQLAGMVAGSDHTLCGCGEGKSCDCGGDLARELMP